MLSYLIRRVLLMIPTLLGITAVVFFIMALAPGNVAEMLISAEGEMKAGDRAARMRYIEERYGLNKPIPVQYIRWLNKISPVGVWLDDADQRTGFGISIGSKTNDDGTRRVRRMGLKVPDLGESFTKGRPVLDLVGEALPITLTLNLITIPLVYSISILTGVYAGRFRGKSFDVWSGLVLLALWSAPPLWIGVVLQGFLANDQYVWWFPTSGLHGIEADTARFLPSWAAGEFQPGYLLDWLWHLALPVMCLTYGSFAFLSKLTRGALLENLSADFVRTARAKGLGERTVLWRHAFRNSLMPLITVAAYIIPSLLGGSVIVEYIFGIPGMGRLMIQAIEFKDQEVVMAVTLVSGVLAMAAYLVADVCYAAADPRVSYE